MQNRRQSIVWTNDDPVKWCIYASPGLILCPTGSSTGLLGPNHIFVSISHDSTKAFKALMSKCLITNSINQNTGFNFNCDGLLLVHSRVMNQTNVDLDLSYVTFWLKIVGPMDHRTIWTISPVAHICSFRSMGHRKEDQYVVQHPGSELSKQWIY